MLDARGGELAAADLRRLCLDAAGGDPAGLHVRDARIVGALDLSAVELPVPLRFTRCRFTDPLTVEGARLHALAVTDGRTYGRHVSGQSVLPGLLANGVRIARDLVLSGTVIEADLTSTASFTRTAALWMTEASIGGRLIASGTQILARGRAMQCDHLAVAGDVRLVHGFRATGEVRLLSARLDGSLDLGGALLLPGDGRALDLAEATVGGSVFLLEAADSGLRAQVRGRIEMGGATVHGRVHLRDADLEAPAGVSGHHDYSAGEVAARHSNPLAARPAGPPVPLAAGPPDSFARPPVPLARPADSSARPPGPLAVRRPVLLAPRLTVHGGFTVEGDTIIRGGLMLHGADLRGGMSFERAVLWNPGDVALDLSQATLGGSLDLPGAAVEGSLNLDYVRVSGPADLHGSSLTKPRDFTAVSARGARIDGDVLLHEMNVAGGKLDFRGSAIAGTFDAYGTRITNPGGLTVSVRRAKVAGSVRLDAGFRSVGVVALERAVVEGRLMTAGGTLEWRPADGSATSPSSAGSSLSTTQLGSAGSSSAANPSGSAASSPSTPSAAGSFEADGTATPFGSGPAAEKNPLGLALKAASATVRGGVELGWTVRAGAVDFTEATTSYLADSPEHDWPADSYLGGFTYGRFARPGGGTGEAVWDPVRRSAWLARLRPYDQRAWEQLAEVLRAAGDRDGAEKVLVAHLRHARRRGGVPWRRRIFDALLDVTIRYGFRPQRALFVLAVLIAAVTVSLSLPAAGRHMRTADDDAVVYSPSTGCGDGKVRCFNPVFYAVDTVVPIIDLHQRSTWYTDATRTGHLYDWWLGLCTVLGWAASTVFALSLTRIGRSP